MSESAKYPAYSDMHKVLLLVLRKLHGTLTQLAYPDQEKHCIQVRIAVELIADPLNQRLPFFFQYCQVGLFHAYEVTEKPARDS